MRCLVDPATLEAWCTTFASQLWNRSEATHNALLMSGEQLAGLSVRQRDQVRAIDAKFSGEMLAFISQTTDRGKLLHNDVAKFERITPGSTATSARAIWALLQAVVHPTSGPELETLEKDLKAPFFKENMSATQVTASHLSWWKLQGALARRRVSGS